MNLAGICRAVNDREIEGDVRRDSTVTVGSGFEPVIRWIHIGHSLPSEIACPHGKLYHPKTPPGGEWGLVRSSEDDKRHTRQNAPFCIETAGIRGEYGGSPGVRSGQDEAEN